MPKMKLLSDRPKLQYRITLTINGKSVKGKWRNYDNGNGLKTDCACFALNDCNFTVETRRH